MIYRIVPKKEDELYHYGVLGMRWGIRRYQNYDGSRIKGGPVTNPVHAGHPKSIKDTVVGGQGGKATGTAKLAATANPKVGAEDVTDSKKSGLFDATVKKGKGKEDSSPAAEIAKSVENSARSTKDVLNVAQKYDPKIKKAQGDFEQEAKKLSDKELRDRINRIKMEREYVSIKSEEVSEGYQKAKDVLDVVGDVAQIAFAVAGTLAMLKKAGIIHTNDEIDLVYDDLMSAELDDDYISHAIAMDEEYCLDYLEHHGVLGMKWGVRRYQNYDGTRIGSGGGPVTSKNRMSDAERKAYGAKEDAASYKYNESGESGWAGANRAINAKTDRRSSAEKVYGAKEDAASYKYNESGESGLKGAKRAFQNSIAGGQDGKAEGNARLAASAKHVDKDDLAVSMRKANKWTFAVVDKDLDNLKKSGGRAKYGAKNDAIEHQKATLQRDYDRMDYRNASKEVVDIAKKWGLEGDIFAKRNEKDFTLKEKRTSKEAKKDAEEFARAKAFYGEGAGNRRKAIKTVVSEKSKKDDFYALEFDYHLSQQDMVEATRQAKMERSQRDTSANTRKAFNKANRALGQFSRYL